MQGEKKSWNTIEKLGHASLCCIYLGRKTEFCHCCSLRMLYLYVIAEELMWFNSHNNKYSLDKVIIP